VGRGQTQRGSGLTPLGLGLSHRRSDPYPRWFGFVGQRRWAWFGFAGVGGLVWVLLLSSVLILFC
jgi:hypothetical protein